MMRRRYRHRSLALARRAVLLVAGVWLSLHRSSQQGDCGGGSVFADLTPALGEVERDPPLEGRRQPHHPAQAMPAAGPWSNANIRPTPARVRELALGLAAHEDHRTQDQRSG